MDTTRPITHQTRGASYQAILPLAHNRQETAYEALLAHPGGLTAGELAEATGLPLNSARSALTELLGRQRVTVLRKRLSTHAGAQQKTKVAVWTLPTPT
jgi:predicted ArsR family transcriptional regulator